MNVNESVKARLQRPLGWLLAAALGFSCLLLSGCSTSVGVGMSVGVPVGDHGYISIGGNTGRWF